jgi:hypothetical protein
MDAYVLIGNAHTRKASVLRSLTGCFNRSVREILPLDASAPLRLYARVGSLQDTRTTPADFVDEAARTRCSAVLCCLSPNAHPGEPGRYPDARAYLDHFKAAGWQLRSIAVLGQNHGGVRSPVLRQFHLAPTAPINVTAREVRAHFHWQ